MPQISILVAVYNTAPYLPQCLDSLCGQTLRDIQIICIDDCSTDQSPQILADYAQRDARITLLRTPHNSGQAAARNLGLQMATGEFTTFVDSDDWLAPDALEQALEALAQNPANDCAVMRLIKYYPDDGHEVEHPLHTGGKEALTGEEAFMLSLDNWAIHGVYVVRTTLHKRFPYDASSILYTDDHVTHLHYLNARRVVMCQGRYYYRQNPASTTRACSMRRFACLEADLNKRRAIEAEAAQGHIPHHAAEALRLCETQRWCNMIGSYLFLLDNKAHFTPAERREVLQRMARVLPTFSRSLITWRIKLHPFYWPFHSFAMLRTQWWLLHKWRTWRHNR